MTEYRALIEWYWHEKIEALKKYPTAIGVGFYPGVRGQRPETVTNGTVIVNADSLGYEAVLLIYMILTECLDVLW
jgi:hypothetical protein